MSPYDPEEFDVERPDGFHRVRVTYFGGGVEGAEEVANDVGGEWHDITPRPFDLTGAEEDYFSERFFTRLAEDAADRDAEWKLDKGNY